MNIKIIIFGVVMFLVSINFVGATVGGPTFIKNLQYNGTDESVYFVEESEDGRGCPPELKKISLKTNKISDEFSCDQLEKKFGFENYEESEKYSEKLIKELKLKNLVPINLIKNKIEIEIDFLSEEKFEDWDEIMKRNFKATVYQNKNKIDEFNISGCSMNQPFVFIGYAIPGFDKRIVLLSSAKKDCWEGGYVMERIHNITGIKGLDKTDTGFIKSFEQIKPNETQLTVFEGVKIKVKKEEIEKPVEVVKPQITGPTGPPNIKGPTSAPPTRAEIEKMKAKAEGKSDRDGLGFWGKIWDWIINLFG